ncbi:hypothetical protein [Sphingobium nicotianae]|uniref:DUF4136 domain-containing protein n=1 Tax=Sphingobium nicotianae TaxID=2782607 RepID=A0A9X1DDN3_9SPHN|nr:hypothetical protein [Sphingobium nicotianae]MBT2187954.1 hypothetical protein [Sphingobium nicotianae]
MTRFRHIMASALPALLLTGCATALAPVDVTRFHGDAVARQGRVLLVPGDAADAGSLEFRTTANAVGAALTRTGFSVVDGGAADFEAVIDTTRDTLAPAEQRRSPVSVGVGGSTGSYGSGLGLGIGINLSGKPKPVVATRLRVQLRRVSDRTAIWEGRAETQAKQGTPAAQPGLAAGKLADALFRDYPGPSGQTITVK